MTFCYDILLYRIVDVQLNKYTAMNPQKLKVKDIE